MVEKFDPKNISLLFRCADPMHDQMITHIEVCGNDICLEYGKIGLNGYRPPFSKLTVIYSFDHDITDYSLTIINKIRLSPHLYEIKDSTNDPAQILSLNQWEMEMYKYDMDNFGEMTIHFDIVKGKNMKNVELRFTPIKITYHWEESA